MQKRLLLLSAACLVSTSALAADLTVIEPAPIYVEPALYDWNGFYVGINGGYGGGVFEHPFQLNGPEPESEVPAPAIVGPLPGQIVLATGTADVTAGGFVGGIQAGYNWQFDENFLIGLEADIQASTIDGRVSLEVTDETGAIIDGTFSADLGTKLDWFATIRPRIGWVNDRFVVYATGGLAWGQTTSSIHADFSGMMEVEPFDESVTNDRFGWTVGAGIEYALTDNITFKTEYLYTDLGSEQILDVDFGEGEVPYTFSADSTVAFHTVRAGLNFQF
ncbi:outer membrane protein [Devosia sp. CN2-171]|jgi:outer membrane immunogenic protein|uniref:outer membrane protein n=1 Tax=Devosia sp. CN2-171 TaxID=3400909 RepID=UPI003BF773D7